MSVGENESVEPIEPQEEATEEFVITSEDEKYMDEREAELRGDSMPVSVGDGEEEVANADEPPAEPATDPADEQGEPAAPAAIDDALLEEAMGRFGWRIADARAFGSSDALRRAMDLAGQSLDTIQAAQPQEPGAATPPEQETTQSLREQLHSLEELDKDDFDESFIVRDNIVRGIAQELAEKVERLEGAIQSSQAEQQSQSNAQMEKQFDDAILGDGGDEELFGTGPMSSLDPNSDAAKNRSMIAGRVAQIMYAVHQSGQPVPDFEEVTAEVRAGIFHEYYHSKARSDMTGRLKAQGRRRTGTPGRAEPLQTGLPAPNDPYTDPLLDKLFNESVQAGVIEG